MGYTLEDLFEKENNETYTPANKQLEIEEIKLTRIISIFKNSQDLNKDEINYLLVKILNKYNRL